MTVEEAREAAARRFSSHNTGEYGYFDHATHEADIAALDVYELAVRQEEHVRTCSRYEYSVWLSGAWHKQLDAPGRKCGDGLGWYCPDYPTKPRAAKKEE